MLRSVLLCALLAFCLAEGAVKGNPDPGQRTKSGCYCISECGATVDFGNAANDWCFTPNKPACGSFSITRAAHYDWCVYPANATYESQTAAAKQALVWSKVVKNQRSRPYPTVAKIFVESVRTSFDDYTDHLPAGRVKYIHSVGTVAQFKFTPAASKYTGVFQSGGEGVIRMSAAIEPTDGLSPGFGIKFFRTGHTSANFMAMPSLDAQPSFNFFQKVFTNRPDTPKGTPQKLLAKKFTQASRCPLRVGLSDAARFDKDGKEARSPNFPWMILFEPTGQVNFPSAASNMTVINKLFTTIPAGTKLFNVFAWDTPNDAKSGRNKLPLGALTLSSTFHTSDYGDGKLMFNHIYTEFDLRVRRDWMAQIKTDEDFFCGTTGISTDPPN